MTSKREQFYKQQIAELQAENAALKEQVAELLKVNAELVEQVLAQGGLAGGVVRLQSLLVSQVSLAKPEDAAIISS